MRQIKFRAWNRDDNKMEYSTGGFALFPFMGCIERLQDKIVRPAIHNTQLLYPFNGEAMQFTGLLDKNGKEIYEGDLIKRDLRLPNCVGICQVVYEGGRYLVEDVKSKSAKDLLEFGDLGGIKINEVIGNIYENKELLQ